MSYMYACIVSVGGECICRRQLFCVFFFQAEDGIRDLVRSRGLGDVYKRQVQDRRVELTRQSVDIVRQAHQLFPNGAEQRQAFVCLLYTSDAADERSSVDLGGRRIIKKKTRIQAVGRRHGQQKYSTCL